MPRSKVEALYGTPLPYEVLLAWVGERYGPEAEAEARAVYRDASVRYGRAATLRAAGIRLRTYRATYGDGMPPRTAAHADSQELAK